MMDMQEAKEKIKSIADKRYYSLRYEFSEYNDGDKYNHQEQACAVYVEGCEYIKGFNWEEVILKLERKINPPKIVIDPVKSLLDATNE